MTYLVAGLLLFIGVHSLHVFSALREAMLLRLGKLGYRLVYTLVSFAGLALIVRGFSAYRSDGLIMLWYPPVWTRHLALLLNWFALVLVVAAYLPCHIRRRLGHPMLAGIKIWATAHLLANGDLGGLILFGGLLCWAVVIRINIKHRTGVNRANTASSQYDLLALAAGSGLYAAIVFWLHPHIFSIPVWPG